MLLFALSSPDAQTFVEKAMANLTPRESQVLSLIVLGKCNKEIASVLGISPRTAKFHVGHLLDKFKVTTRMELLSLWARVDRR